MTPILPTELSVGSITILKENYSNMLIYFTNYPIRIKEYTLRSDLHAATRRFGIEGMATGTIAHDGILDDALFYNEKLIAIMKDRMWYAALDDTTKKFPRIDGIETFNVTKIKELNAYRK